MSQHDQVGPLFAQRPAPTVQRADGVAADMARHAWDSIERSGWAAETLRTVYRVLYERGPLTRDELDRACHERDKRLIRPGQSTYVRRLYELKKLGAVDEHGSKLCPYLDKEVTAYAITGHAIPATKPPGAVGRPTLPAGMIVEAREAIIPLLDTTIDEPARTAIDALDALIHALQEEA